MMNQTNTATKSLLAKLLATENLRVEHDPKASTASFDLKNRVLRCPVWADMDGDMYDMLLGHEVSHAKNTPADGWHTSVKGAGKKQNSYKHFLNIVEDARIEKLIKRQYPGLRRPFVNAYKALYERDIFQVKGVDTTTLFFIDRVNLHCKMGFAMNIRFSAAERALITLVENAETWDDVVAATKKIWEYSKNEQKEDQDKTKRKIQDMSESLSGDEEEEEQDGDDQDDDFEWDEDEDNEDSEDEEGDQDEDNEDEDGESNETKKNSSKKSDEDSDEVEDAEKGDKEEADKSKNENDKDSKSETEGGQVNREKDSKETFGEDVEDFVPTAKTDEAFRKNELQLNAKNAPTVRYIDLPAVNLDMVITPAKSVNMVLTSEFGVQVTDKTKQRVLLEQFQDKNRTFITSMAKEFEMKKAAKSFAKAKIAESGDINISKLGLYRTEDDIFKKVTTLHKGKSHGLVLLLDKSGSMRQNMAGAIEQLLVLASFCRKVNIPFVAYGFTNHQRTYDPSRKPSFVVEPRTMKLGNVGLREIINSNMKAAEFTQALMNQLSLANAFETNDEKLNNLWQESLHNTPLNEALVALLPMIRTFKTERKLDLVNLVIVHDGDADYTNNYWSEYKSAERFDTSDERIYFRDKVSQIEILAPKEQGYRATTVALMEMIRRTCGVGIYGFFIGGSRGDIQTYYTAKDGSTMTAQTHEERTLKFLEAKELTKKLNKEKFLESWTPGYNRFYMLPTGRDLKVVDAPIVITGPVTARKLSTAFIKQGKAKYSNRVLVSRFIDGIAK